MDKTPDDAGVVGTDLFATGDLTDENDPSDPINITFKGENVFQAVDDCIRMGRDAILKRQVAGDKYDYVGMNSAVMQEEQRKFLAHREPLPGEQEFSEELRLHIAKHFGPFNVMNHQARIQALMGICVDHFAAAPRLPATDAMWRMLLTYAPKHLCEVYREEDTLPFAQRMEHAASSYLFGNSFSMEPTWSPENRDLFVDTNHRTPESVYYGDEQMKLTAFIRPGKTINLLEEFRQIPDVQTLETEGRLNLRVARLLIGFQDDRGNLSKNSYTVTPFGDAFDLGWGQRPQPDEVLKFGGNIRGHIGVQGMSDDEGLPPATLGQVDVRFDLKPSVTMDTTAGDCCVDFEIINLEVDLNHVHLPVADLMGQVGEKFKAQIKVLGYELCVTVSPNTPKFSIE